jgi:hypothetical protein
MKTNAIKNETMPRTAHDLLPGDTADQYANTEIKGSYRTPDGKAQIDFGITYCNGYPEYTSTGHFNGSCGQCLDAILAAYPEDRKVKLFHTRWKLHHLKNAEMFESLVRQEAARFPYVSFYETQAQDFLSRNGLKFRATLSDSKTPAWAEEGEEDGHHYRVTISRDGKALLAFSGLPTRLVFDFWGSIADAQCQCCKGKKTVKLDKPEPLQIPNPNAGKRCSMTDAQGQYWNAQPATLAAWKRDTECPRCKGTGHDPEPKHPSAYDVLACISGDAYTPETFADFCAEYGYESDSIKALQQFRRCDRFAKRLRAFFTEAELTELSEIR